MAKLPDHTVSEEEESGGSYSDAVEKAEYQRYSGGGGGSDNGQRGIWPNSVTSPSSSDNETPQQPRGAESPSSAMMNSGRRSPSYSGIYGGIDHEVEEEDDDDGCLSEASSILNNGSVVSTIPDRHGFIGGSQYSPDSKNVVNASVVLRREKKWLEMIGNWDKYMSKHYKKIRERCRKGIPLSMRPKAWLYLCGGKLLMDQHWQAYTEMINQPGDVKWLDEIKKDLHRQFPYHQMFLDNAHGQQELFNVLKVYSIFNKNVGYCQAQAPLAAFLLMHMPAEEAFWCLVSVCDKYVSGYYSQGMETLLVDGDILFGLLKKVCPPVHKHLKKQKIEPILYMTEWFLCIYTRTLPWPTVLRVWDMFLCEGVKVVFKVGLVLLKYSLTSRSKSLSSLKKHFPTMYETLDALRNPPAEIMEENFLVDQVLRLNLTDDDFEYEHKRNVSRRKASGSVAS